MTRQFRGLNLSACIGLISFAAVVGLPATLAAGQQAASSELCWRSLAPGTDPQDVGMGIAESQLAATRSGEIWLSRLWNDPSLLTWAAGKWTSVRSLTRDHINGMGVEAVAASPSGRVVVVAGANRDDFSRELHVGSTINGVWQWLGAPLISSNKPEITAQRASIAFARDQPVVAWSESHNITLGGVFVARWDGAAWTRLGALSPSSEDLFLTPAITVDSKQQVWVAWSDANEVRVVRWDGSTWIDVGRDALKTISASQGPSLLREISLAAGTNGHVWVLRLANKTGTSGSTLALARWDGSNWSDVPAPRGPEGKDSTAWSASMILRNDAPVIAWSQSDITDNHHLYVSEWTAGDRWTTRLSNLHFVEGVSNVTDVKVASGDGRSLIVSWDEPAKDQGSTRVIEAHACAAGEKPASPPTSTVERDTWPTTVDEAAKRIVAVLDDESKTRVRATAKDQLIMFHHGWGMGIRNSLGLWRGNEKLLASCGGGTRADPERCSMVIIEAVWTLLQAPK